MHGICFIVGMQLDKGIKTAHRRAQLANIGWIFHHLVTVPIIIMFELNYDVDCLIINKLFSERVLVLIQRILHIQLL